MKTYTWTRQQPITKIVFNNFNTKLCCSSELPLFNLNLVKLNNNI